MHPLLHSLVKWELINVEGMKRTRKKSVKTFRIFMILWLLGYKTKRQSLSAMWVFLNSSCSQIHSFTVAWTGFNEQMITLSLTTSHQIMTPLNLKQFYSRRREIEGEGDWQETLNYNKIHIFCSNFSTLQITTVTMSKTQLLPSALNNLRISHISSWTSWETMPMSTSVRENWTYI